MDLIRPDPYRIWRERPLGALVEGLELDTVMSLAGPLRDRRVLDVGCGDGTYLLAAAERGARAVGVDHSERMLRAARSRARRRSASVELARGDAAALPFPTGAFDVVFAVTVLTFSARPLPALRELSRVLAPGGRLVLAELGEWSLWTLRRRTQAILGSRLWRQAVFRSPAELRRMLADAGLVEEDVRGAIYFPPGEAVASLLARLDPALGRLTPWGAAFIAGSAVKPAVPSQPPAP